MSYANEGYSKDNLHNYFLLTFLGSVLGEAVCTGDNLVAFNDESIDQSYDAVFVYLDYVNIVDDASILSAKKMYQIIGFCQFHNIEYKINECKQVEDLVK